MRHEAPIPRVFWNGAQWHGGCYPRRGSNPETGGQKVMAVDTVLLHIVIALGVMALAAHTASSK
jgi:hypothetical protein